MTRTQKTILKLIFRFLVSNVTCWLNNLKKKPWVQSFPVESWVLHIQVYIHFFKNIYKYSGYIHFCAYILNYFSWTYPWKQVLGKSTHESWWRKDLGAKYYWVRKAVCGESEAGTPSRKEVLESVFMAYKYVIHIAGTENLQILNSRRQYLLFKILPVFIGFFRFVGYMLVLMKSMQFLTSTLTELGFYIRLLTGPLLGLKSDLQRNHMYLWNQNLALFFFP